MSFPVNDYRKDFPLLQKPMREKRFVYLDSSATSLTPISVAEEEASFYYDLGANIHRGVYQFSEEGTWRYDQVRQQVSDFLGSPSPHQIIFTRNATESLNLIAYSWGNKFLKKGDAVVATELEHHSNLVPWQELCKRKKATLDFLPLTEEGEILEEGIEKKITEKTKLVTVTAMSNVTGYMPPIEKIIRRAREVGAVVVLDGAQYASHHAVNLQTLDADFFVLSAHKMLGPTGVGILYGKKEHLDNMDPFLYGGDMIQSVWKDKAKYASIPNKFEAGTPNIAGVLALGKAIEYLEYVGLENILKHEQELLAYAFEKAEAVKDLKVYGPKDVSKRGGVFSFNLGDIHPHDTGSILDNQGVAVRTGFHCAQPLMRFWGITGTTRASFYLYSTKEEVDILFESLKKVREVFK